MTVEQEKSKNKRKSISKKLQEAEDLIYRVSGTWWQVKDVFERLVEDYEQ